MFEELIEKIKALDMGAREFHPYEKWTWIDAIEAVVEAINASEPPELDAPDSDGWWWYCPPKSPPHMNYIAKDSKGDFVGKEDNAPDYDISSWEGKWVKAIMPRGI